MPHVLLADIADVIRALLPILIGAGWILWQVISAVQAGEENKKRPAQQNRPAPDGENAGGAKQADLRSEVDDFLRRLQEPEAAPKAEREKPHRPRIEVLVDEEPAAEAEPRRLTPSIDQPPTDKPKRPAAKNKPPKPNRKPKPPVADQASKLSERIAQADDLAEERIHEKFDHQLGKLSSEDAYAEPAYAEPLDAYTQPETANEDAPPKPVVAESIAAMLREPDNVRNAVILNEILRRPSI